MQRNQPKISLSGVIVAFIAVLNAVVLEQGLVSNQQWYWLLLITAPAFVISFILLRRKSS